MFIWDYQAILFLEQIPHHLLFKPVWLVHVLCNSRYISGEYLVPQGLLKIYSMWVHKKHSFNIILSSSIVYDDFLQTDNLAFIVFAYAVIKCDKTTKWMKVHALRAEEKDWGSFIMLFVFIRHFTTAAHYYCADSELFSSTNILIFITHFILIYLYRI